MSDTIDDDQVSAAFDAGFAGKAEPTSKPEPETRAEPPRVEAKPEPEYVQITKAEWAAVNAKADKASGYDQKFAKLEGTTGNLQTLVSQLRSDTPRGHKIEIPKEAFADMEKDFPELAQYTRAALEKALSGVRGTGPTEADETRIETRIKDALAAATVQREVEALEDVYPTWRDITDAVSKGTVPNPENSYRKWLTTKDATYQARINTTESAAVIGRSIRLFQTETKAPAAQSPKPRDEARAERIRSAVQPRGDGAGAAPKDTAEEAFAAGFSR